MTNGDRIRQMSNKELLDFLIDFENDACICCLDNCEECNCTCGYGYQEWIGTEEDKSEL